MRRSAIGKPTTLATAAAVLAALAFGAPPISRIRGQGGAARRAAAPVAPRVGERAASGPGSYVGSLGCNGRGCHGQVAAPGEAGSEYTTWIGPDRHSKAYEVLFFERSRSIVRNFRRLGRDETPRPERDALCLSCHDLPHLDARDPQVPPTFGGVGCEACHGPASEWLGPHARPDWKAKDAESKAALGLVDLANAVDQARACLPCHVGSLAAGSGKDVNHDLIAAGHPRLNFELASFFHDMPRHWDRSKPTDSDARRWLVGQVATAEAGVRLLAERAGPPPRGPWPEFAEADCYGCHFDLTNRRFESGPAGPIPAAVTPAWRTWDLAMLRPLAESARPSVVGPLDLLARRMSGTYRPDAARASAEARDAARELEAWLVDLRPGSDTDAEAALRRAIAGWPGAGPGSRDPSGNWDALAPFYNAGAALRATVGDGDLGRPLDEIRRRIDFGPESDSPEGVFPGPYLAPLFRQLQQSILGAREAPARE